MITWDEPGSDLASMMAASAAKTARGPDAHIAWPATGREILAACERARDAARNRRPRFVASQVIGHVALVAVFVVLGCALFDVFRAADDRWADAASPHHASRWSPVLLQLLQVGLFVGSARWSWARARTSAHPRWLRAWAVCAALFAASSLLALLALLLEARTC
jgi:hypothetical protein